MRASSWTADAHHEYEGLILGIIRVVNRDRRVGNTRSNGNDAIHRGRGGMIHTSAIAVLYRYCTQTAPTSLGVGAQSELHSSHIN